MRGLAGIGEVVAPGYGGEFASVSRIRSIRMVPATVTEKGCTVWQLDVQTAFIYVGVEEEVWVKMAPG